MTSSNDNIFRFTGHLCGEFTVEFPAQWPVVRSFDDSFDLRPNNGWVNNREACDLRRHHAHYDVTVIKCDKCNYLPMQIDTLDMLSINSWWLSIIPKWNKCYTIAAIANPAAFTIDWFVMFFLGFRALIYWGRNKLWIINILWLEVYLNTWLWVMAKKTRREVTMVARILSLVHSPTLGLTEIRGTLNPQILTSQLQLRRYTFYEWYSVVIWALITTILATHAIYIHIYLS